MESTRLEYSTNGTDKCADVTQDLPFALDDDNTESFKSAIEYKASEKAPKGALSDVDLLSAPKPSSYILSKTETDTSENYSDDVDDLDDTHNPFSENMLRDASYDNLAKLDLSPTDGVSGSSDKLADVELSGAGMSNIKMKVPTRPRGMSFSLYVDSKTHMDHHQRTVKTWVTDTSVTECYKCKAQFSMWCRRHHCRACGKIFCYYCACDWIEIPREMMDDLPTNSKNSGVKPYNKVRVCTKCKDNIDDFNKFFKLAICLSYLDLKSLNACKSVSKLWNKSVMYCTKKLREIQYKLPTEEFSQIETNLLLSNQKYFGGHSVWIIQILKVINYNKVHDVKELRLLLNSVKGYDCWHTMCTRNCTDKISFVRLMDIISLGLTHPLINGLMLNSLDNITKEELILYLPFIGYHLHKNIFLFNRIIDMYITDDKFMSELYWCVMLYNRSVRFKEEVKNKFKGMPIWPKLVKMSELENFDSKKTYRNIVTPIDPDIEYDSVYHEGVKVLESASAPTLIPLIKKDASVKRILYKKEDIRKDHIISNLIHLACMKLREANVIDTDIITYKVAPTTDSSGFIEIVENSTTIFNITENLGFTVQNYINEHNPDMTARKIKERFMKSTAVYCVISYLLGFGDRHLDNIMISESGLLFHIDFSYILGRDPKYSNSRSIKLTPEIVNAIGGYNSENYKDFKRYCSDVYNELRLYINMFMNMLSVVTSVDPSITEEHIRNELLTRFETGATSIDAALHMDTRIRLSGYTFEDKVIDFLYKSKNSNIVKGLKYIKDAPVSLVKNYITG